MKFLQLLNKPAETGVAGRHALYVAGGISALLFVVGIPIFWWIETTKIGLGVVLVNWLYTVLTGLLVFVVFTQVGQARRSAKESLDHSDEQRRKWATLQACDRYDTDDELRAAVRHLRKYHWYSGPNRLLPPGVVPSSPPATGAVKRPELERTVGGDLTEDQEYALAATLLLNYFDSVAIGIEQEFYVESICREHTGPIFTGWMNQLRAENKDFDKLMAEHFERLPKLLERLGHAPLDPKAGGQHLEQRTTI